MAAGQPTAEEIGAHDIAGWLVAQGAADPRPAHRQLRLAQALGRWGATRHSLAIGQVGLEHAEIIVGCLGELSTDTDAALDPEVLARAEEPLIGLAGQYAPRELRRLAAHTVEVIAPDLVDASDARTLARQEKRATQKATLSITSQGDGSTRIHGLVPDAVGQRLRLLLEAHAQPRVAALDADGQTRPRARLFADALGELLESIDPTRVPAHGGDATTVVVTVGLDALRSELGTAELAADSITATEARRLACTAKIVPAVLGGASQPLDLGRAQRLFSPAQRKALRQRDRECRAEGCTVPATWCDAHHHDPWSNGGRTDLDNGLCSAGITTAAPTTPTTPTPAYPTATSATTAARRGPMFWPGAHPYAIRSSARSDIRLKELWPRPSRTARVLSRPEHSLSPLASAPGGSHGRRPERPRPHSRDHGRLHQPQ